MSNSIKYSNARINVHQAHSAYDRFPAGEFDNWISGLTASLKSALNHDDAPTNGSRETPLSSRSPSPAAQQPRTISSKGKERDPRNGPGLGVRREEPIEILSEDSEDEACTLSCSRHSLPRLIPLAEEFDEDSEQEELHAGRSGSVTPDRELDSGPWTPPSPRRAPVRDVSDIRTPSLSPTQYNMDSEDSVPSRSRARRHYSVNDNDNNLPPSSPLRDSSMTPQLSYPSGSRNQHQLNRDEDYEEEDYTPLGTSDLEPPPHGSLYISAS